MIDIFRDDDVEEIKRLQALLSYNILDTSPEEEFENLVKLISHICHTPIALISLVDDKRQWHKAKTGLTQSEAPRAETFCQYTIQQEGIMEIPDARQDERVKNNIHVTAEGGIRFYAGIGLKASNGCKIGTVCVVDTVPKELTDDQRQALRLVADQTMVLLEARKKNKELSDKLEEILNNKIKDTQKQLIQKETEYNLLLRAIKKSNAVVEFSPEGIIKSINDNFLKIIGYSREEIVGNHYNFLLNDDQKENYTKLWSSLRKGKFYAGRLRRKHKDGSLVYIQASYNPITNQQNEVIKVITIAQDITSEIEAEKSLKRSKELAEKLNVQKDTFIANMSHEIRTPIHAILGFTELLLEQEEDSIKESYMQSVKTAGDNLLYIINDILDLSKIEAGIIQLDKEPFDLLLTIKNVFAILHLKAHQKKLSFTYHIGSEVVPALIGDKNRLTQILINLLGNAIKFTPSGSVRLSVNQLGRENGKTNLEFKVVDTGIGVPKGKLETIFDRFSQAEEDTGRNFGGTGLGLNISQQLIKRQGGSIQVESEGGKGSVFIFNLPFEVGKKEAEANVAEPVAVSVRMAVGKILLCEDNELNQKLVKAILTEKGYSVDLAENGEKGVQLLNNRNYDLILMDIQMPLMDGYEATRRIRQEMGFTVPIVALTANFLISERAKCLQTGMNDYLAKPFTKEEILAKVDHWVSDIKAKHQKTEEKEQEETQMLSLSTLEELSGGDKIFQQEIIILFLKQAKEMYHDLLQFSETENLEAIKATAHKLKTSFGVIGADANLLHELENITLQDLHSLNVDKILDALKRQLNNIFHILNSLVKIPKHENSTY